ncbi:hypothetical protein D3C72_1963070 [compost metagenome]
MAAINRRPHHGADHCRTQQGPRPIPTTVPMAAIAAVSCCRPADGQGTDQQDDSGNETVHKTTSQENPTSGALLL